MPCSLCSRVSLSPPEVPAIYFNKQQDRGPHLNLSMQKEFAHYLSSQCKAASPSLLLFWDYFVLKALSHIVFLGWEWPKSQGWVLVHSISVCPRTLNLLLLEQVTKTTHSLWVARDPQDDGHGSIFPYCSSTIHNSNSTRTQTTYFRKQEQSSISKSAKCLTHLSSSMLFLTH